MRMSFTILCLYLALALNVAWVSPAVAWPEEGRAAIFPTLEKIAPGDTLQFHATQLPRRMEVSRPATDVSWSVNGVPGGNDTLGRIDANGHYHAPGAVPKAGSVYIRAAVLGAANRILTATVLLGNTPDYRSLSHWPAEEVEKAGLVHPGRIAFDSKGHILVLGLETGRMARFTADGTYLDDFGRNAEGNGIGGVSMMAIAPAGVVYTGDRATGPPRINGYKSTGDWFVGFGQKGSRPGMIMEAAGMAFHPDGRIYVADMDAMRVSIFDGEHRFLHYLRARAPEGHRSNVPSDVAMDEAGDLFVASAYGPCEKVSPDTGERLFAFAYPRPPRGMMYIDDICLDRWGNVYLAIRSGADPINSGPYHGGIASIMKYTNTGEYLTTIKLSAKAPTRVSVAVDDEGKVYAAWSTAKKMPEVPAETKGKGVTAGIEVFTQE